MKLLFAVAAITLFNVVSAHDFQDCGSRVGSFTQVTVSDCQPSMGRCVLHKNSTVTIEIEFTTSVETTSVTTVVHGIIMNVPVPFPLPQPDACTSSGVACPLEPGVVQHYVATLPVQKSYPKVKVDVKWELKNQNDDSIVCVLIPAKIQ